MRQSNIASALLIAFGLMPTQSVYAQGYDEPLTIQGLDRTTLHSAASRGAGGITFGLHNDVGVMFANPAALQALNGVQFSVGGVQQSTKSSQVQQYTPLKYYSNFSLLMEGLTAHIPDPSTGGTNAGDSVQRPYDTMGPNWSRSKSNTVPLQGMVGVPFSVGEQKLAFGLGVVEYADLNSFHQNNNVLSPAIGAERPFPIPRPSNDSVPVIAQWSQFSRVRDGKIRGYGAAFSAALSETFSMGVSGMVLKGSSDDLEQRIGRGKLTFFANYFRLDSVHRRTTSTGTSDYSGMELTISSMYRFRYLQLGFSLKPPSTLKREFTSQTVVDTNGSPGTTTFSGTEDVRLPWRGTVGVAIAALENLSLGLEYEFRPYASAVYRQTDGSETKPWLSGSLLRAGVEFIPAPWLTLRAGIRGHAEVFEAQGNPLADEPVTYTVYSAGVGVLLQGVRLNVAYEYAPMKYQDIWQTNVNLNNATRHSVVADLSYEIPWNR